MNVARITVFLFVRGTAGSEIENLVASAQLAAALDTLAKLRQLEEVGDIVVSTADASFAEQVAALGAYTEVDPPHHDFSFGQALAALVTKYNAETALYVGGGSGALERTEDWRDLIRLALDNPASVVANNYYSSDFAAWSPGSAIHQINPPVLDNDLAFRLGEQAGLRLFTLPKNAATQLDIDTPTDLLTISLHPDVGPNLRSFVNHAPLDTSRVLAVRDRIADRKATVLVAGRVSASMCLYLERETRCQWRIYSEERGMRASGREARGEVHSLLGYSLEQLGPRGFFDMLEQLAQTAVIDSRVLFGHFGLHPTAQDRFCSDMMLANQITDPFIRSLTSAARDANMPVLFGGHSLVSGGMYSLAESIARR